MKRIVFLFIQCLFFISLSGKEAGYSIRNYGPKEYGGFNQVWCSVQDSNGVEYFGTSTNIFAYDGKYWTAIPVVQGNPIRSMRIGEDGIIYVGSYGSFGYLERQPSGNLIYRELSDQLPVDQRKFPDVWKVFTDKGEVIFQTSQGVYFFKNLKYVTTLLPENSFALSFYCNGHLYIRQRQVGLQEIINHKLQNVPGGEIFADSRCLDIIPWKNGKLLLLEGDSGFYSFSPSGKKGFSRERFACDNYLRECFSLGAKYIDDSTIAIPSRTGIGFIDINGNLVDVLTTDDGLIDNAISSVELDREGQLWLTTGNGLSHVFYHSNAHYFRTRKSGYDGDPSSVIDFKDRVYLGTTSGLYRSVNKTTSKNNSFELLGLQDTELWGFLAAGEDLLIASTSGTCVYREGKPIEFLSTEFTRDIVYNDDSTMVFCAELGGVRVFQKKNNKWESVAFAETPGEQQSLLIAQYNFSKGERIWSIGQSGVLYRFDFNNGTNTVRSYSTEAGIQENVSMFCIVGDSICAKTGKHVYVYHPERDKGEGSDCFTASPYMFKIIADKMHDVNFTCTEKGKLIRTTEIFEDYVIRRYGYFKRNKKTGFYDSQFLDIPECSTEDFIYSYVDSHGNFWLCFTAMLVHVDGHIPPSTPVSFNTIINRVNIGKNVSLYSGINIENKVPAIIEYKENSVVFRFAAPIFNHEELTTYSYRLEGFDKDTLWSQFSASSEKEYTNLAEGDYVFMVRSCSVMGDIGKICRFNFTILPPWYRTIWAYCIYFIVFIATIYFSIRLSAQRLRHQKEKLEVIVAERTAEVVEQKQKIETQNFELESAYKGIQDSIHYAERIQHAILPVASEIHNSFPDAFVFFRPRDIVSGDFYWLVKRGNLTWIACVDCTGHGVPGAFMSMIGNTLLNEIVLEKNIEAPHKILELLHIRIRQALRQDAGGETRDGMDISLCLVNHEKQKLSYAGANRALWLIRNNDFIVLPPDKYSIGGDQWDKERHFTLHEIDLISNDCIYLSSDGFADQFGGPKGKKFMVKRFQQLLLQVHSLPMEEQQTRMEKAFTEWKDWTNPDGTTRKLEQVDDVLVIGFRIKI